MNKLIFTFILAASLISCKENKAEQTDNTPSQQESAVPAPVVKDNGNYVDVTVDDKVIKAPKGSEIQIKIDKSRSANGKGAGIKTSSEQVSQNFKSESPQVSLNGSSAMGGGLDFINKMKVSTSSAIFYTLGGLTFLAGLIYFVFVKSINGLYIAGAGLALVAVGVVVNEYPLAMLVGLVAAIGGIVAFVFLGKNHANLTTVVENITKGVADASIANPEAAAVVKEHIDNKDGLGLIKDTVRKIKKKHNLN